MTASAASTDPAELAAELARRSEELAALDAVGRLAGSAGSIADFLEGMSRIVEARTLCRGLGVFLHEPDTNTIELLHHHGIPAALAARVAQAPVEPPAVFTTAEHAADVVSPTLYPARFRPAFEEMGVVALARVPLVVGARTVGVLAVAFADQAPEQAATHLRFLRPVGALVGAVISEDRHLGSLSRRVEENSRLYAELERTQEQLLQRERLAALGALSAAVAHEVRNPLGVIFNAVGMLRRHRGVDDEGRGLVDIVAEEAERLNRIVADLLGFARPNPASLRPASLGPIVEEAVRAGLAGSRIPIDVSWELSTELPPVAVDSGLVRQALINVVVNAAQAMPRGGRLQVRTAAAGGWATIEVTDSGHGIPPELRARVFEPFFTTRTSGTGLGLAIVRHVVEAHGGSIEVAPGADGGTRFALRLPLVLGGSAQAAPPNIG